MKDIMIDIETLSHRSNAVIVSIGAVQFDINSGEIGKKFYVNINPEDCEKYGLDISASTVMWWMGQSWEAKNSLKDVPVGLSMALNGLTSFIEETKPYSIWANSPSFDLVILQSAYNAVKIPCPWKYWQERCLRTLSSFSPNIKKEILNDGEHNALSDCLYQIKYCTAIYNSININH